MLESNMNKSIVYCRVSTAKQSSGTSFDTQMSVCKERSSKLGLVVSKYVKDVHTAYNSISELLVSTMSAHDKYIIFYDVSRFCRKIDEGIQIATSSVQNGNHLVFCVEDLTLSKDSPNEDWDRLKTYLTTTNNESNVLGRRIKDTKKVMTVNGKFLGGGVPYGYSVRANADGKWLVPNQSEIAVLDILKSIKNNDMNALRRLIRTHSNKKPTNQRESIKADATADEIATFLNKFDIKKRGKKWTKSMVLATCCKMNKPSVTLKRPDNLDDTDDQVAKRAKLDTNDKVNSDIMSVINTFGLTDSDVRDSLDQFKKFLLFTQFHKLGN